MQELFEMVVRHARGMWRFRWRGLAIAWIVAPLGWLVVFALPDRYEARASVYVNTESALQELTEGLVIDSDLRSQLELVKQTMLSREHLEKVARDTDLDLRVETPEDMDELIAELRERIVIRGGERRRDGRNNLYSITFQDRDRQQALAVVRSLLDTFLEDTIGVKVTGTDNAQRFLQEQIQEYERRLAAAEKRLSDFKRENVGMLPGERDNYFARLQREIDALENARTQLREAESTAAAIRRQMSGETELQANPATAIPGMEGTVYGDTVYDQRIRAAQQSLETMLLRFTDKHPDVIAMRETIERLKQEKAQYISGLDVSGPTDGAISIESNPVYERLRLALNEVQLSAARLRAEIETRAAKVAELRRLVDTVPKVEAELARLNRDYGVTQRQYQALVQRLEVARVTEQKDLSEEVDFRIIDPPVAPYEPVAPRRFIMISAVLLAALGLGGGLAFLLNQLKPVFNSVAELRQALQLPVLGAVSHTWRDKHAIRRRMGLVSFTGAAASLLAAFALAAALSAMNFRLPAF